MGTARTYGHPMFRTIVVGYDGPERGDEAVALAEALRDPRHGSLLLTSAYPPTPFRPRPSSSRDSTCAIPPRICSRRRAPSSKDRVPVRTISVPAAPARALTETAEREHADLVVVGSSHRGDGRAACCRARPRSDCSTARPARSPSRRAATSGGDIRRIGVAYEGSPEAEAALRAAEALALELDAALTVYCVVEPPPATDSMIAAGTGAEWPSVTAKQHGRQLLYYVADHAPRGLKLETLLLHGHAAEQIARRSAGVVDLLFAGSRGYGPLRRALLGSVSGALVRDAGCPVVITPRSAVVAHRGVSRPAEAAQRLTAHDLSPTHRGPHAPAPDELIVCPTCGVRLRVARSSGRSTTRPTGGCACAAASAARSREVVVSQEVADRYDRALDRTSDVIASTLARLDRERMTAEVEAFTTALAARSLRRRRLRCPTRVPRCRLRASTSRRCSRSGSPTS